MNQIWIGLIVLAFLVTVGLLIPVLMELRKTARSLRKFLKTTEESIKPTLEELQQTLKSIRNVSDDVNDVTGDIKTFSGSVRDVGHNIRHMSNLIEDVTSSTVIKASGLRVGIKTALEVLLNNLFSKKGGRQ
ncbi:MAG: DUF948 domain-containing protein [Nitrospirota bacterium]